MVMMMMTGEDCKYSPSFNIVYARGVLFKESIFMNGKGFNKEILVKLGGNT